MARISLRAYQRDIEELVETHQFDQAIAHCRHILRFYPKEVNTYRLLGKAYLESQRYGDASDIFIRVLSTIPDDFVSHVGMSIIREDEGNLDEAIWHMQRAFETQPANSAIQGELRRLHGRREGIEPPKIRLTRGALARMYLKGELYPQALAELRAGLHEDPKRYDLQVVLVQAYYLAGQRVDAAEASSSLLKSLPFCLEANKILADILSHSERADEAQVYNKRVQSLDPYVAHLSPAAPAPEKVADSAVLLEKLEWRPGIQPVDTVQQPEWATSLGVDLGTVTEPESLPDWLGVTNTKAAQSGVEAIKPFEEAPSPPSEPAPMVENAVPDWMKEAGWTESQVTGDQEGFLPLSDTEGIEEDLAPADIPDWLKPMAPSTSSELPSAIPPSELVSVPAEETEQAAVLPWLEETPPGPTDSVAMWLETQEPTANIDGQLDLGSTNIENIPDWLQDLGEPAVKHEALQAAPAEDVEHEELILADENKQDQLNIGTAAALTAAAGLIAADQETEAESTTPSLDEPLAEAQIPEWLQDLEPLADVQPSEPSVSDEILKSDSQALVEEPLEQAVAGLNVEAESGDWVPEIGDKDSSEESPVGGVKTAISGESLSLEDDEAFAWLENLAARQGAEEALLLSPDERRDTPPDWILSEANEQEAPHTEEQLTPVIVEAAILAAAIPDVGRDDQEAITPDQPAGFIKAEQLKPDFEPETIVTSEPELHTGEAVVASEPTPSDLEKVQEITAEAVSAVELTTESEMLFYPLETAEDREGPVTLDEGPIAGGDTQPTAVKAGPKLAVEAIAAATVVIGTMPGTDEVPVPAPSAIAEEEAAGVAARMDEQPQFPEPSEASEEVPVPSYKPEKLIAEGVVIPEEDEAFAWLESLAARQGAEEALLLTPEERLESPPEWVMQDVAEAEKGQLAETLEKAELPEWLQEAPVEAQEVVPASTTESDVPDWLKQPAAIPEETTAEEELPPLAPELPTWLAGVEDKKKEAETTVWSPSEESFEAVELETIQSIPDTLPEAAEEPAPVPALNLNKAGLIDLERLPGIGFTRAQAILDYREQHGLYQDVDELLLVTGITPDILFELKEYLCVGGTEVTAAVEPPAEDHQILLMQARNALVQGDIPLAISRYGILIDEKQMLPDVITDLNEALYRFPIDVAIWEALGDAHMRAGHLQEALNAYTKAEEYLR